MDAGRGLRRGRFRPEFRRPALGPAGRGRPTRHSGGRPRRLLRAVRDRASPRDPRPQGQDRQRAGAGVSPARLSGEHRGTRGPGPSQGHRLGDTSPRQSDATPRRREDRCLPRISARTPGTPGEGDRARSGQQLRGPTLVAILLLRGIHTPGVRPEVPGADQAGVARHSESGRRLCPGAGTDRRVSGRQGLHAELQLRPANHERASLRQVAGVRPRGYGTLLCPPPVRGRHGQVQPPEDPRPGHQLALSQRAEEGAEGVDAAGASRSGDRVMERRTFVGTLTGGFLAAPLAAEAQQPGQRYRIGFISMRSGPADNPQLDAFRDGLRELGYVEGRDIVLEIRYAAGKRAKLPDLATELVRLKVDLIVTQSGIAANVAKKVTRTIPIVMVSSGDAVGQGLVASLARPGGNVTGLTMISP